MERLSPILRISAGLVFLTCTILATADMAGLIPAPSDGTLATRLQLSESLATQTAISAEQNDLAAIRTMLQLTIERNPDIISGGLRAPRGRMLVAAGDHRVHWSPEIEEGSTLTHVRLPLFKGGEAWATLEIRFAEPESQGLLTTLWERPLSRVTLVVGLAGFVIYGVYMRRTLRHLDPSAVIPTRVQAALDVMAEGVLLIDEKEHIVLANQALATRVGRTAVWLMGKKPSELGFEPADSEHPNVAAPWISVLRGGEATTGTAMCLPTESGEARVFNVNSSPVLDGWGRPKGAIVTFDDVTELERKSEELEKALVLIEKSQDEIRLQNEELQLLARRDPLTGVANRRAFMESARELLDRARREGSELSCIMADLDHFKQVNDGHGHAMGDEVIRRVAELMVREAGSSDTVCRYGGEEFCMLLPESDAAQAEQFAERLRKQVASPGFTRVPMSISLGISALRFGANSEEELIAQADDALYASKQAGRDRVTRFDRMRGAD